MSLVMRMVMLGRGTVGGNSARAVAVAGISRASAISAGGGHTCALLATGTVRCWGDNRAGQLGSKTAGGSKLSLESPRGNIEIELGWAPSPTPVTVGEISTATVLAAGLDHTCVLLADGAVRCWGGNVFGQLGRRSRPFLSLVPVPIEGL